MPIECIVGRKGPPEVFEGGAFLHMLVARDIDRIVIIDKVVSQKWTVGDGGDHDHAHADEDAEPWPALGRNNLGHGLASPIVTPSPRLRLGGKALEPQSHR